MAKQKEVKTLGDHLASAAKYSGSSLTIALALTQIIIFLVPRVEPISEPIYALIAFFGNLLIVVITKKSESIK